MAQDDYIRTALRVPPDLHKQLHDAADAKGRSFNAEIIERLQESFAGATPKQVMFLISKYEAETAEAELDKHILYLMVYELSVVQKALSSAIRKREVPSDNLIKLVDEWDAETEGMLEQAKQKVSGSAAEAAEAFNKAMDVLVQRMKRVDEAAAQAVKPLASEAALQALATDTTPDPEHTAPAKKARAAGKKVGQR